MNNTRILIIIPVFNEEKAIRKVVAEIKNDLPDFDILVVDDCSTDSTPGIVKQIDVSYLSLPFNLGYSSALQIGFKYAVTYGYDYAVQFDGDGQHIALELKKMVNIMESGMYDIVIGSRFMEKSDYKHSPARKIGTAIFSFIIRLLTGKRIYDPTSGFQVLGRNVFTEYSRMHNYPLYPDANLLVEMLLKKYRLFEVQVEMRNREDGVSMHTGIIGPIDYMTKVFYSIFLICIKYLVPSKFIRNNE